MIEHWNSGKTDKKEMLAQKLKLFLGEKFLKVFDDHTIQRLFSDNNYNIYIQRFNRDPEYFCKIKEYDLTGVIKTIIQYFDLPKDIDIASVNEILPDDRFLESRFTVNIDKEKGYINFNIEIPTRLRSYLKNGLFNDKSYQIIRDAIHTQKNILISSPTGAGKTTFLNILTKEVNAQYSEENVIVIERQKREIICKHPKMMYLTTDFANNITTETLLQQAEQLMPAKIIIDEVNEGSLRWVNMLLSSRKRKFGSIATIHAASNEEAINRLTQFCLDAGETHEHMVRDTILSSIDIFINLSKDISSKNIMKINDIILMNK